MQLNYSQWNKPRNTTKSWVNRHQLVILISLPCSVSLAKHHKILANWWKVGGRSTSATKEKKIMWLWKYKIISLPILLSISTLSNQKRWTLSSIIVMIQLKKSKNQLKKLRDSWTLPILSWKIRIVAIITVQNGLAMNLSFQLLEPNGQILQSSKISRMFANFLLESIKGRSLSANIWKKLSDKWNQDNNHTMRKKKLL